MCIFYWQAIKLSLDLEIVSNCYLKVRFFMYVLVVRGEVVAKSKDFDKLVDLADAEMQGEVMSLADYKKAYPNR